MRSDLDATVFPGYQMWMVVSGLDCTERAIES